MHIASAVSGSRKTKYDAVSNLYTGYAYDTDTADPSGWAFPTENNRLLSYEVRSGSASGTLLRTVKYIYYKTGDVCNISLKDEYQGSGDPNTYAWWYDLALYPYTNGAVALTINGKYKLDGSGNPIEYARVSARQFGYDDPRARWMARDVNPTTLAPSGAQSWTDYTGVVPWGDFDVSLTGTFGQSGTPVTATDKVRYLDLSAEQTVSGGAIRYWHGDLIGSTVLTTDLNGDDVGTLAYTAFGEPIGDPNALQSRYRYAGGWGYESGFVTLTGPNQSLAPITLQHVGALWYQPDVGRFAQRDPLGIRGSTNLYNYAESLPTIHVDPCGEEIVTVIVVTTAGAIFVGTAVSSIYQWHLNLWVGSKIAENNRISGTYNPQELICFAAKVTSDAAKLPGMTPDVPFGPPTIPTSTTEGIGVIIQEGIKKAGEP